MAAQIIATGVSVEGAAQSSIERAAQAAEQCIRDAGIDASVIDVLVNVGVYRDANTVEPSIAALIQQRLGINLDFVRQRETARKTFSFDLMNGACGILNAVQVGGAMIESGHAEYVLIVSSDTHPSVIEAEDFPYANVGGAMLLGRGANPRVGFGPCAFDLDVDGAVGREGIVTMSGEALAADEPNGRNRILIRTSSDYQARLTEHLALAIESYAAAHAIELSQSLLLTSQAHGSFGGDVAEKLGLSRDAAVRLEGMARDPHTSSLTLAYHAAVARGLGHHYRHLIFAAAGSGISVACAAYQLEVKD